ncbi:DapH/DapD/GlmU-related protein [uncultured Limosilactobacillus sp.]|uniref:DapH/DapD/GlmU-related protein n=1 Tax=uncultured Limosilactobacillus sp. TaxID=2837629 RepID=UPI0026004DAC|nr:DapH/DapD/GlmU-related protein [uncultured Limosilactobacillus sp.]
MKQNQRLLRHLNTSRLSNKEIHQLLSEIFGYRLADSTHFLLPFYSDYGRNIRIGKNVAVSCNVTMADRGGITIGNNVEIGSGVSLLTVNGNQAGPIKIDSDVKIGGNVIILPGVRVGTGAIIGAGTIVAHDVSQRQVVSIDSEGGTLK